MKVLIGNFHNGNFGGGEFYTYQVAKAISAFAEILFVQEPNKNVWVSNPSLRVKYSIWDGTTEVDHYLHFSHFKTLVCNTAKENTLCVFFPNKAHKVRDYQRIVAICEYSAKYVKEYWHEEALVCQPYSKNVTPAPKKKNTILNIGNFFKEPDGHSKNQHVLIDAFKRLGKGWKLVLVGNVVHPAYLEEVRAAAKGLDVEIIPNASESVKDELLATSEFYWHANGYGRKDPYQTEHFGIAPEEAKKAGCLTYVHASGGSQDFCKSWETVSQLVNMTKKREENTPANCASPETMASFWEETLCSAN